MTSSAWGAARVGLRLALRHHPLCGWFDRDVLRVGPLRVCAGCAVAAPALLLGLLAAPHALRLLGAWGALMAGILLGVPHLLTYVRRGGAPFRRAAKALGGLGLAQVMAALLVGFPTAWAAAAALAALALAFVALQGARMLAIRRACLACPWKARWDACPGFAPGAGDSAMPTPAPDARPPPPPTSP